MQHGELAEMVVTKMSVSNWYFSISSVPGLFLMINPVATPAAGRVIGTPGMGISGGYAKLAEILLL